MRVKTWSRLDTILVMDDDHRRHAAFQKMDLDYWLESTYTAAGAIEKMGSADYHMVCLDHDLGTMDDGRTVARWLQENPSRCPKRVIIHSQNPVGAERMYKIISTIPMVFGIKVKLVPFKAP